MASYFATLSKKLNLHLKKDEKTTGLRECQIGAYWATLAHFTASEQPALIVLPTGAGKTALAMLLSIGLAAERVLLVTPALVLRDQTANKFSRLDDLTREGILPNNIHKPKIHIQEKRIISTRGWNRLRSFDLVVATTHTISPEQHEDIAEPPGDLFDLVFFDEAHHTPAPTWDALMKSFKKSRIVLLTATPFREDKRKLQAHIVYNYPIGRAIDKGIYEPIRYHPVLTALGENKDAALCEKVRSIISAEKRAGRYPKLLIRANRVNRSGPLLKLYASRGVRVDEINYAKSLIENGAVLQKVRRNELDGIVCIGMLGEGLDIPALKIAIFHDPPQSLPFTLQFIGRISRTAPGKIGPAHVVANPDDVRGEIRKLYMQDARWRDLIPRLVDEVIGEIVAQSKPMSSGSDERVEIDPYNISPFFSVRVYRVSEEQLELNATVDLGEKTSVTYDVKLFDGKMRILITHTDGKPPWASRLELHISQLDLHIYYYHEQARALFEYTTSDSIASIVKDQIIKNEYRRYSGVELARVLRTEAKADYLMLGLANVLGRNPSLPTYKILMGKDVQGSVRASEGRVFSPGHALARISEEEVRGIAGSQGRVWSIKRSTLHEYKIWCDRIARRLRDREEGLPGLEFLPSAQVIHRFSSTPIGIVPHHEVLGLALELAPIQAGGGTASVHSRDWEFEVGTLDSDRSRLGATLLVGNELRIRLTYNLRTDQWVDHGRYVVKFDGGQGPEELPLREFLTEFPPSMYVGDGSMIVGGDLFTAKHTLTELPSECLVSGLDWSRCDTRVEFIDLAKGIKPVRGKLAVQDWLEGYLRANTSSRAIILKDHGTGEIADFVVVEPDAEFIAFYHCKAARTSQPTATIADLKVLEQVVRTVRWIGKIDLLTEVERRAGGEVRPNSALLKGSRQTLASLAADFRSTAWDYWVILVQPGLNGANAARRANTNALLMNAREWLQAIGASLSIMSQ